MRKPNVRVVFFLGMFFLLNGLHGCNGTSANDLASALGKSNPLSSLISGSITNGSFSIASVSPLAAYPGDIVTIKGVGLADSVVFSFNDKQVDIVAPGDTSVSVRVPDGTPGFVVITAKRELSVAGIPFFRFAKKDGPQQLIFGDPASVCSGIQFYDILGKLLTGTKTCPADASTSLVACQDQQVATWSAVLNDSHCLSVATILNYRNDLPGLLKFLDSTPLVGSATVVADTSSVNCTANNVGELIYSQSDKSFFFCQNLKWNAIDLKGDQGVAGLDGTDGATGAAGQDGTDGATGLAGKDGTDGAQGVAGNDGKDGTDGAQGIAGQNGTDGATGPQGPAGQDGTDGAQGIAGQNGTDGATGPQGPAGQDGTDGAQGIAGQNGTDGATGPQGPSGQDGTDGAQGIAGNNGQDGTDGATGPQGPTGPTGSAGAFLVSDASSIAMGLLFSVSNPFDATDHNSLELYDSGRLFAVSSTGALDGPSASSVTDFFSASNCSGNEYLGMSSSVLFGSYLDFQWNSASKTFVSGSPSVSATSSNSVCTKLYGVVTDSASIPSGDGYASVRIDSAGNRHVAYQNGGLVYATCSASADCNSASNWTKIILDSGSKGYFPSLAVVGSKVHISYQDKSGSFATLKYISCASSCNVSSNWSASSVVDNTASTNVGSYNSLVANSSAVHISYQDSTNGKLKYATCALPSCSSFTPVIVEAAGSTDGAYSSIAVDGNGRLHIAYQNNGPRLSYATCSTSCTTAANWTKVALFNPSGNGSAAYTSLRTSMASSNAVLHVLFQDNDSFIKYMTCTYTSANPCTSASNWSSPAKIDSTTTGYYASLDIDGSNVLYASFQKQGSPYSLKYAQCSSSCSTATNWAATTVDNPSSASVGTQGGLAVGGGAAVILSFGSDVNYYGTGLKYSSCTGSCSTQSSWNHAFSPLSSALIYRIGASPRPLSFSVPLQITAQP